MKQHASKSPVTRARIRQFRTITLLLAFAGVALILLVLEGSIRRVAGDRVNVQYTTRNLFRDSLYAPLTHGWKSGETGSCCGTPVSINSLGTRGPEIDLSLPTEKLLLLGDSVLFGPGIPDSATISGILRDSTQYTIINSAVIGYNTIDYVQVLKFWQRKTHLNHVLLFLCLNDIYRYTTVTRSSGIIDAILARLRSNSKLYMVLKNLVSDRSKYYFLHDLAVFTASDTSFSSAMQDLLKIRDLCASESISLRVIVLPYEYQIRMRQDKSYWQPQRMLADFFVRHQIPFSMPDTTIFKPNESASYYLYADGIHFSRTGQRVLAEYVLDEYRKSQSSAN
ncbi:SGNH/GDSL hydrolase family protein [candidate division KSB1 bacterium]|nr:SGNH/GDSL hydrolase family protein [candidate division KSB1 bacterium]